MNEASDLDNWKSETGSLPRETQERREFEKSPECVDNTLDEVFPRHSSKITM